MFERRDLALTRRYLALPAPPPPPPQQTIAWHGVVVARSWPAAFTEEEYRVMSVGGKAARLAVPDTLTRDGRPIYKLTEYERREARRLLDHYCLNGQEHQNIVNNQGINCILTYLSNVSEPGVQYFAVGTGAGTPGAGDPYLFGEFFRKQLTISTISGNQVDMNCLFGTSEGNTTYTECGIFGNVATSTANSGNMFAHAQYAYVKDNTLTLSNDYYVSLVAS